ncbi:hypothetical protein B4133_0196 [Bacillus altitudinis]|uniref:hypothetical protein n=1 Tax=Bacillus altitudinis TaxID=293387 RepID=UPI0005ADA8DC|nr:hypothetical protein [Bacillus altitudinis]KIL27419.1 hypothetical protein B4133_0196 [Bacillus altitudinis]
MRGIVEVIWLEDRLKDRGHEKRLKFVKSAIENKGYESNIEQVSNLEDAKEILLNKNRRVDFFISDYNLGDNETGLDYLIEVRNKELFKQFFILYSNNDYDQIREDIIAKLKETRVQLFSNFTFISLASSVTVKQDFENAVKISLSRWDELNAMRGLYMCEHAELEWLLRVKFEAVGDDNKTYKQLFNQLKNGTTQSYKGLHRGIFKEWENEIGLRNLLAHTSEEYDTSRGFCIKSTVDKSFVIYEDELDKKRAHLKGLKEKILFLIEGPNRSYPSSNVREPIRN